MAAAAEAAAIRESWVPRLDNNNRLKLAHKNDNTCLVEESRYNNNHPEIYNNDQEQPNEQQNTKVE